MQDGYDYRYVKLKQKNTAVQYNKKDPEELYFYNSPRSIFTFGQFGAGWLFYLIRGYFALPLNNYVNYAFFSAIAACAAARRAIGTRNGEQDT